MVLFKTKTSKIILLYCIAMLALAGYYLINSSGAIATFLTQSNNRGIDSSFGSHAAIGLVKYLCLISGALLIGITTLKAVQKSE